MRQRWGKSWKVNGKNDRSRNAAPIVIVDVVRNAMRIVAMANDTRLTGIYPEQTLSDARAIIPSLDCVRHDPHADSKLLIQIARWCERYTPLVSISDNDGLFLDITGCTHLFDGEEKMLDDVKSRLIAQGFDIALAIADTAGTAWALARYDEQAIAKPKTQQTYLEPMQLSALRLPKELVGELSRLGFKTIGCLIGVPRAPITARFGEEVLYRLDQALGLADEVLSPFQPIAELVYEKRFPEPIVYEDDIKGTIKRLANQLHSDLEQRGLGLRQSRLQLFRADGEVVHLLVETSAPLRDAGKIASLFDERLASLHDEWDAGFGFDIIQLSVLRCDKFDATQTDLVVDEYIQDEAKHLIDRLSARLGGDRVQVYQRAETHIPERSFRLVPALHQRPTVFPSIAELTATRPILLFARPERADVMAEVPEGAPLQFRWRKVQYEVICSEGPERIACEWWKDGRAAKTRDYFRIETKDGYRLWLFRHGLYERETNAPAWYVHGLFA